MEQICLKSLLQRLRKLLVDVKNSKHLQKMWEQKQIGNKWEMKKKSKISGKSRSKTSRSRKDIFDNKTEYKPKSFSVRGFYKFFHGDV